MDKVAHGSADLIVATSTWWAGTDSVDPRDAAVLAAQHATAPLTAAILVGGVLVAAIRMILSRKAEPLAALAAGLVRFALVSALGLTVLQVALQAGDVLARQLLGDAADKFAMFMRASLTTSRGQPLRHPAGRGRGRGAVAGAVAADGAAPGRAAGSGGDAAAGRVRAAGLAVPAAVLAGGDGRLQAGGGVHLLPRVHLPVLHQRHPGRAGVGAR